MIYIVATPIGNLEDISFRAIDTLKKVDYILAEDTRQTSKLLKRYEIEKKMVSFNDMNKEKKAHFVIQDLKDGKEIAVVSDSGTPGISDPGFYIVRECVKNNIKVIPVPGATAFVSALVCSGLATDRFTFYGFLPKKEGRKRSILELVKQRNETAIFYTSPHRLKKDLELVNELMPECPVAVARELTKKFEEILRGTASEVLSKLSNVKGEIVLVLGKCT